MTVGGELLGAHVCRQSTLMLTSNSGDAFPLIDLELVGYEQDERGRDSQGQRKAKKQDEPGKQM